MPTKQSHEIFADFYTDVPSGKSRMATAHGVHTETAQSWSRPKPSDYNPTATGKGNPIDQTVRAMRIIHPHDPVRVREVVEHIREVADELDRAAGVSEAAEQGSPCRVMALVAKKHLELVLTGLGNEYDEESLRESLKHAASLGGFVIQLKSCIEKLLNTGETENDA